MFYRKLSSMWTWTSGSSSNGDSDEEKADAYQARLKLKKVVDNLVDEGISTHIDLPQVVVVGSQSSGKSSIFEGIAEIPLPRDDGLCTRCPIICRMSCQPSESWSCRIELVRKAHNDGRSVPFGAVISDKEDVGDRILRAQAAIIYPDTDAKDFLDAPNLKTFQSTLGNKSEFSSDSILVDIQGPAVMDLSFVDLPGIIADHEEDDNVDRVRALVTDYIKNEACLILVVYSCTEDTNNQGARRLAKFHDPEGNGTIFALTKPDRIDGRPERWLDMVRRSNNCFCVRQPSLKDIEEKMSRDKARQQEMSFFQRGQWLSLYNDPSTRQRLGTKNLKEYLNIRLLDWIVERVPQMRVDLNRHLRETQESLGHLPASIDNPIGFTDDLLSEFADKLSATVDIRNFHAPKLVGFCRRRVETFVNLLLYHLFPRFCPFSRTREGGPGPADLDEFPATLADADKPKFTENMQVPEPIYLDEVLEESENAITRELHGNYPYGVLKNCMEASVETWREQTEILLEDISKYIEEELRALVSEHFGTLKSGGPIGLVWGVVGKHIELQRDTVREILRASLEREKTCSLVYGRWELFHHKDRYLKHYLSGFRPDEGALSSAAFNRVSSPANDPAPSADQETDVIEEILHGAVDVMVAGGVSGTTAVNAIKRGAGLLAGAFQTGDSTTDVKRPPYQILSEAEQHAIKVMAQTRAFYHIAVRRYTEGTVQIIFHDLLLDLKGGSKLMKKLRAEIGISGSDAEQRCIEFIEPSEETRRQRADLERRKALIEDFLKELNVVRKHGALKHIPPRHVQGSL